MTMRALLFITGHSTDADRIARHGPLWRANSDAFRLSMSDHAAGFHVEQDHIIGPPGHSGPKAIQRMKAVFRQAHADALALRCDAIVVGEPDTVIFRPIPEPEKDTLHAPLHVNTEPHRFRAPFYAHPVLRMTTATLGHICDVLADFPDTAEDGFGDRLIPLLCDAAGIAVNNDPLTYSRNALDTPEYIAGAQECLRNGGWGIHGIKTGEQLNACLEAAP